MTSNWTTGRRPGKPCCQTCPDPTDCCWPRWVKIQTVKDCSKLQNVPPKQCCSSPKDMINVLKVNWYFIISVFIKIYWKIGDFLYLEPYSFFFFLRDLNEKFKVYFIDSVSLRCSQNRQESLYGDRTLNQKSGKGLTVPSKGTLQPIFEIFRKLIVFIYPKTE